MIDALKQSHKKTTQQLRDLELKNQRNELMIKELRQLLPQHLLEQIDRELSPNT